MSYIDYILFHQTWSDLASMFFIQDIFSPNKIMHDNLKLSLTRTSMLPYYPPTKHEAISEATVSTRLVCSF